MFILTTFNAFLMVLLLTYVFYRLLKTKKAVTLVSFTVQLSALTIVILSLVNDVKISNSIELFYIGFGILIPSCFILWDYRLTIKSHRTTTRHQDFITVEDKILPQVENSLPESSSVSTAKICQRVMDVLENEDFVDDTIAELNLLKDDLFLGIKKKLIQAENGYSQGNFDFAYEIYKSMLDITQTPGNLFFNYGNVYFKKGMFREAVSCYRKVLELNEQFEKKYLIYVNLGITYFNMEKTELALENFFKALEINPECPTAKEGIGRIYTTTGRQADAVMYYEDLLKNDDSNYELSLSLGKLLVELGNIDEAKVRFETCIKNNPQQADAYILLGKLFMTVGQYSEAIKVFKTYITINDVDYIGHYNLAECYFQNKEYKNAIAEYMQTISHNQKSHESLYKLGLIYDEIDEIEKAIDCYRAAIQLKSDFIDAYNNLGIVFAKSQRHVESLAAYTAGIKLNPDNFRLYFNMGVVLFELKRYEDSADAFVRAVELNPEDKDVYYYLGASLTELKQYDEAIKAYGKALDDRMQEGELYYNIAAVYALMKKQDIALDNLKKAVCKDSDIKREITRNSVFDYMRTNSDFIELVS
ncbi:tetratricopeptide repeat protein [Clostridium sp. BNL1100]|uniref:tetratricopeptide repeat protein n=1 Tax=Clostridium sp. BNL1100 TaxID=755731 RepID=UPI00024A713E|nr:tetratricopeptide repeat protein [Clostridium sp. BNL1100]AEY65877.1 Tfp pilus assembly protein PilF [Clostridium sp. BNL1100]